MIKQVSYIIHIPMIIIGFLLGTVWVGFAGGFSTAVEFWWCDND